MKVEVFNVIFQGMLAEYENALADITKHIINSHVALSGMTAAQAEVAYIQLAQQIDNIGSEYIKAKVSHCIEAIYLIRPQFALQKLGSQSHRGKGR